MWSIARRRRSWQVVLATSVLFCAAIAATDPARGQQGNPSPEELWQAYPLDANGDAGPRGPAGAATPGATPGSSVAPTDSSGAAPDGGPSGLLVLVGALVVFGLGVQAGRDRHRRSGATGPARAPVAATAAAPARIHATAAAPAAAPARVHATAAAPAAAPLAPDRHEPPPAPDRHEPPPAPNRHEPPRAERRAPAAQPPAAPAPVRREPLPAGDQTWWTCQVAWKPAYVRSRFRAIAIPPGGRHGKPIAESPTVHVPPMSDPEPPTDGLRAAHRALATALTAAGWAPAGHGPHWYSDHFAWTADGPPPGHVEVAPEPAPASTQWTCDIAWKPAYIRPRFRAIATPPGARRGKPIAESPTVRVPPMSDPEPPTPALRAAHRALATALATAGWTPAGHGSDWYSHHFIWSAEQPPPGDIDVAAVNRHPVKEESDA